MSRNAAASPARPHRARVGEKVRALAVALCIAVLVFVPSHVEAQQPGNVRIAVLSLFHPRELILHATANHPLQLLIDGRARILDARTPLDLHADGSALRLQCGDEHITAASIETGPAQAFELEVPHKLRRLYRGSLRLTAGESLQPVITMTTETAVASIVQAESPPHAPLEALKAQAIVSRSYLLANLVPQRAWDATDTTRDQFLRSPPPSGSPAAQAARSTAGLLLLWQPEPGAPLQLVAAMYSRACPGTTRTLAQIGRSSATTYPFYPVRCPLHTAHPELWSRELPTAEPATEKERIDYNRTHGWQAIPATPTSRTGSTIQGSGQGHGVGLCQTGAADLARQGASAAQILALYLPNTVIRRQ